MSEKLFTVREAAEKIGITQKALSRRAERGTVDFKRGANGERLFPQSEIERLGSASQNTNVPSFSSTIAKAEAILSGEGESELESTKRKLVDALAEASSMRNLLNQYNARALVEDRLVASIERALSDYPYTPKIAATGKEPDPNAEHQMLLLVSDAHYPEVVNPQEAMGIEYGPEIVRRRMEHITERTLKLYSLHENNYPINKITIGVLGDMLSGNIHEELEITNALPMGQALTDMSYMLYDMGCRLAEQVPNVEMIILPGNHPRMTKKPRFKQKYDNFEYIMGQLVKALARDTFDVVVPEDIVYAHDIMGYTVGMMHGDGSKANSFAGIPFYGLKNRATAMQAMRSTLDLDRFDMVVMGHFHQMLNWTVGDCHVFLNGAIKGGDEYSIVNYSSATDPVQALLTFHEDHGWINTERIPLEKVF